MGALPGGMRLPEPAVTEVKEDMAEFAAAEDMVRRNRVEELIPAIRTKIRRLYLPFDQRFSLHGAELPVLFSWDRDVLGAYVPQCGEEKEHFVFSLYFAGFTEGSLTPKDKRDLFLHEYAHYMCRHMDIPDEYRFRGGPHGSAWKYCCSLIGAAPSEVYRSGMGAQEHDYEKLLRNPMKDKDAGARDLRRREKEDRDLKKRRILFSEGETVIHPKFGEGMIKKIEQTENSVRLQIRFPSGTKNIDQRWLDRSRYTKRG